MRPLEWVNSLLQRHGLEKPDGRPLYQYRLTEQEFSRLTSLLKLSAQLGIDNITKMLSWDAAFVMYAAEWWRRYYIGQWGWDGIFDSIGISYQELSTGKRNSMVESGLHRWRREVRVVDENRRLLGTVATEGGLPLNQLSNSGGWLRNVLQPTLRKHLSRGINISVLIDSYEDSIPSSYRSTELNQILEDITQTVVTLRRDYDLKSKEQPIAWLDSNHASWRELFPLPIDDSQAASLLGELIDTASRTRAEESSISPFAVDRTIIRADTTTPELIANIDHPAFVFLDSLGFDAERGDIPSPMNLEVYEPGGSSWLWCRGILTTYRDRKSIKLAGRPLRLKGDDASKELRLRFKHVGEILLDMPLPGGEPLDAELPWLFRCIENKWRLHGTASQSIKDECALVFIPAISSYNREDEESEVVHSGDLFGGELVKLTGTMFCHCDDAKYRLSTGQEEKVIQFSLRGKKCTYASVPKEIYIGQPELVESNLISGSVSRRHDSRLLAKKIGVSESWHPLSQVGPGYYEIRLTDGDGNTQLRKRVGILAEDFQVNIKPDRQKVKSGIISFKGAEGLEISVSEGDIKADVINEDGRQYIHLEAKNSPPLNVDVSIIPAGQKKTISMKLPYPSKGALLFDDNGDSVSLSNPLNLNRLQGYRLKLFDDQYLEGKKASLVFTLVDSAIDSSKSRDIYIESQVTLSAEMTEFSIYDWHHYIDSLISVGSSIDAMVRISLSVPGQKVFELFVSRYESSLSTPGEGRVGFDLHAMQSIGIDKLEGLKISVMNLAQPEQNFEDLEPNSSQGVLLGTWEFNPESRADGPWVIYPSPASVVSFRPKLWNIGSSEKGEDIHTLAKAMLVADQIERASAIKSVMREMADEPDHRSWGYLSNLWLKTEHLPLTTFDIWRLTISEPAFLAALFIHDKQGIVSRLEQELPVIWELVRVNDWEKALSRYQSNISRKLGDDELVEELLRKKIIDIESLSPSLLSIGKILRGRLLDEPCPELSALNMPIDFFLGPRLTDEYQNLLRRQAETEWPKLLSSYIYHYVQELPQIYRSLVSTYHGYQTAVTFLPWIMAWKSLSTESESWPETPAEVFKLQQLIRFDEDWFSAAFQYLSGWLSQQEMESL